VHAAQFGRFLRNFFHLEFVVRNYLSRRGQLALDCCKGLFPFATLAPVLSRFWFGACRPSLLLSSRIVSLHQKRRSCRAVLQLHTNCVDRVHKSMLSPTFYGRPSPLSTAQWAVLKLYGVVEWLELPVYLRLLTNLGGLANRRSKGLFRAILPTKYDGFWPP
jgi:hypothetical protein